MLRYYSYYSIGGYKDLYLGSDQDSDSARYYLPLLPVIESSDDPESKKQYEELKNLPMIRQLSDQDSFGLPSEASSLISHGGYKLIYRHVGGSVHALALRDIKSSSKDDIGRNIPFLILITGDSLSDARKLDVISAYMASYLEYSEETISSFIGYDMEKNGLRFSLADFNSWLENITKTTDSCRIVTSDGVETVKSGTGKVALLTIPDGSSLSYAVSEQKLLGFIVKSFDMKDIICKADTEKLVSQLEKTTEELNKLRSSYSTMKMIAIAACVAGFVLGLLL